MALGEMVPWRWGSLRRSERDEKAFEGFHGDVASLHREMDRLFNSLWNDGFSSALLSGGMSRMDMTPQLDVAEDDEGFSIKVDLPGMDEKDVDVTLSDRVLTIRGKKEEDKETREKDFYRRERAYGSFRRSIELPAAVDDSKIDASFKKGVLKISLPKSKEARDTVRHIDIKAA